MKNTSRRNRALALALTLVLCLGMLPGLSPGTVGAEGASFFQPELDKLVGWGVMQGYPDGSLAPDNPITRAEFVALVNRAYGFTESAVLTPFTDVNANAWYADDIGIAYNAGYYLGSTPTTASPGSYLTREQALVLLARNMRLPASPGEVTEFSDGRDFDDWSRAYVHSAMQKGIITGYDDGTFRPKSTITRGEMAAMLTRSLGTLVSDGGITSLGEVYGNVTLSRPDTTLQNTTVAGDLYISGGLGLGSMTLENVDVMGEIVIAGGGESNAGESVILRNTTADNLLVDSLGGQYLSLRAEGDTLIPNSAFNTDAFIMDNTPDGSGLQNIYLNDGENFTVAGNVGSVTNNSPLSSLIVGSGAVQDLTMGETAVGSTLRVDQGATVRNMNLDTGVPVTGDGDVSQLNVNTAGSSASMLPDKVDIRPGLTANVAGQDLNRVQAEEIAAEPRLLAGYPKVINIAPTSATGVFALNKAGTVYWGISAVASGSINERDLITPPVYGNRVVKSGKVTSPNNAAAGTEFTVNISGLTGGSNYYLSCVMVDEQGNHSPVKVTSFTTPDNTVPNFTGGTPSITRNSYDSPTGTYQVQALVIPTKSCRMHWALYHAGVTAPRPAEFQANSLPGALAFGSAEAVRNREEYIRLHNFYNLQELTDYVLYVWLNDADNGQSSRVANVAFTTIDGTPPVFQVKPTVTSMTNTAIRMIANIDEPGTIYWAAVVSGTDYPKAPSSGGTLTEEYAVIQVKNGMNAVRSGKANARANVDVNLNASGLQPETSYDIWYVAEDTAGNHSVFVIYGADRSCITASTLDSHSPTVEQEFTRFEESGPYTDTDIRLVFSERIQHTPSRDEDLNLAKPLDLYNTWIDPTQTRTARNEARVKLAKVLKDMISLYSANNTGRTSVLPDREHNAEGGVPAGAGDWYIDYYNATVTMEDGRLVVTFPHTNDANYDSAHNIRSGATYYITVGNVCDLSANQNIMPTTRLDNFTTISAQVEINDLAVTSILYNGNSVPADLAFTLHPIGTNQVDDALNWDMLLWTDSYITFDLYSKQHSGVTWTLVGSTVISRTSGETSEFLSRSLHQYLESVKKESHPINSELVNDTDYVIHITKLRDEADRNVWSSNVRFRVSVVTGSAKDVPAFTQKTISVKDYADAVNLKTVSDIGMPIPFERTAPFADKTVPQFTDEYPTVVPSDQTAVLTVQLDHPGTVYYAIAPAENGPITTRRLSNNTVVNYNDPDVPRTSNNLRVGELLELSAPSTINIYDPTYTNKTIVTGQIECPSAEAIDVNIQGLEPQTKYFLYTVEKGPSSDPSEYVHLFQFETTEIIRPQFWLTRQNPRVQISTNMTTTVSYMVLTLDQSTLSGTPLNEPIDVSVGGVPQRMPIYEAISTNGTSDPNDYNSLFDLNADEATKTRIANYIRNTTADGTNVISSERSLNVTTSGRSVDVSRSMSPRVQYIFLAVGQSSANGVTSGDSFRGIYPLSLQDTDPPLIESIDISQLEFSQDGTKVKGPIYVRFNEELYYLRRSSGSLNTTLPLDLSATVMTASSTGYVGYGTLTAAGGGLTVTRDTSKAGQPITSIEILTGNVLNGSVTNPAAETTGGTLQLHEYLCDEFSNTIGFTPTVRLTVEIRDGVSTATATVNYRAGTGSLRTDKKTYNIPVEKITAVTLNHDSVKMTLNGSNVMVTAQITPADTPVTYAWSVADPTVADIVAQAGNTVTLTPLKIGVTNLTLSAYNNAGSATATVRVEVTSSVDEIELNTKRVELVPGSKTGEELTVNTKPAGAKVEWSIADGNDIVILEQLGDYRARVSLRSNVTSGNATVKVSAVDDPTRAAVCEVVVVTPTITLPTTATVRVGKTVELTAETVPADATINVSGNYSQYCTVVIDDHTISITGVEATENPVTLTFSNGTATRTCTVTVEGPSGFFGMSQGGADPEVESVTLSPSSLRLEYGQSADLTAVTDPEGTPVTWEVTEGGDYIRLDESGSVATVTVRNVPEGKVATATVTARSGEKSATATVTIEPKLVITSSTGSFDFSVGMDSGKLILSVEPWSSSYAVSWTSDNNIIRVATDGTVSVMDFENVSYPVDVTVTATITASGGKKVTESQVIRVVQ